MLRHAAHAKRYVRPAVLVALAAATLFGICAPVSALRPRHTPAHMAALAAADRAAASTAATAAAARHDAMISRMVARHDAAGQGSGATSFAARTRLHRPAELTARGVLAVATFAALAAIVLLSAAIVVSSRTEEALRHSVNLAGSPGVPARRSSPDDALRALGRPAAGARQTGAGVVR